MTSGKICFSVVKIWLLVSRGLLSRKNHLFDLLFFWPFWTSSGKNFVFRRKFFEKIVKVHSTCAEENSEESKFSEENYTFLSILEFEKNCLELRDKNPKKKLCTLIQTCWLERYKWFFLKNLCFCSLLWNLTNEISKSRRKHPDSVSKSVFDVSWGTFSG